MKTIDTYIKSIQKLNTEAYNIEYCTQARVLRANLYSLTGDIEYTKTEHRKKRASWGLLKEESTGTEVDAKSLNNLEKLIKQDEETLDELEPIVDALKVAYKDLVGKDYIKPKKKKVFDTSSQEIDNDFVPRTI